MALRIRKSITLGAGVARDIEATGGGARYELKPHGRRGTRRKWAAATPAPAWTIPAKPGLRAPRHERDFFMGLEELKGGRPELALQRFEAAARRDTRGRALSDDLLAGLTALELGNPDLAAPHLEVVVASDVALPDGLLSRYAPELAFELSITPAVGAVIRAGSLAAALALVECYQEMARYEEATGVLQQLIRLDGDPALRVSLCELYAEADDWDEIAQLAAGTENADDLTLQTLLYLGCAHAEREEDEKALAVYGTALSSRRRPAELLMEARYERGRTHLRLGNEREGLEDLEEVYALDPEYRDVAQLLERVE
jgi:tetratricopeptide (TPR) repeat protein